MKRIVMIMVLWLVASTAQAMTFQEGTHYKTLNAAPAKSPTVTEYFSFYHPHCYAFEPIFGSIRSQLPAGVSVQRVHVSYLGGNMAHDMSKAYATMVALGIEQQMVPEMFAQIHQQRRPPQNHAALRQVFINHGVDGNNFDRAFKGFSVDQMVRKYDVSFARSGLTSVPSVVVNNRYLVTPPRDISRAQYVELINFLLRK
ncbi:thiol:disulfide interchange protein DsbA/DsbL [Magnetofaba australis]